MSDKLPISAFVICLNEAARIRATLESVNELADEIVVVDSGSTDGTQDIARAMGAKVMQHEWQGYGPQKRFAEEQCTHDWLLNLDADEVLSGGLIQEIREAFAISRQLRNIHDNDEVRSEGRASHERAKRRSIETSVDFSGNIKPDIDGYAFKIRDCVPGEARPRPFAHMTRAVRLYNKHKGRYADSSVHDRVQFTGADARIHTFSHAVYHYSVTSMEQAISKLNRYSTMQAEDMEKRGTFPALFGLRLLVEFPVAFFKSYVLRGDILRGRIGFVNAMTYAFSRFARIAKALEKR